MLAPEIDWATERWRQHMRRGDFEVAWQISDLLAREKKYPSSVASPLRPFWDGEDLTDKRVFVYCCRGLGDTIQFARYLPQLQRVAPEVTVYAQPALIPLLGTLRVVPKLRPLHNRVSGVDSEALVEIMELAHVFRTTLTTIPADVPYFHVAPAILKRSGNFNVGVVWQASHWDLERSIPFDVFCKLANVGGVTLHVLQRGSALAHCPPDWGVASGCDDVLTVAAIMKALDLVITVDSMPAHLAGALGVPVWTLLKIDADWRWFERHIDSPWYPSMRLFRQRIPGIWGDVLEDVASTLQVRVASARAQPAA